jgi:hypothetical protein
MLKWVGHGLQIAGNIMTAEAFDEWAQDVGGKWIEEKAQTIFLSWLAGETRARRAIKKEITSDVNSETFRAALNSQLDLLPIVLLNVADVASEVKLLTARRSQTLVAVPRSVIQEAFISQLVSELSQAAELQGFKRHPKFLLRSIGREAEETYANASMPQFLADVGDYNLIIVDSDTSFAWPVPPGSPRGHLYVVRVHTFEKKIDKNLREVLKRVVTDEKARLGAASKEERDSAFNEFVRLIHQD